MMNIVAGGLIPAVRNPAIFSAKPESRPKQSFVYPTVIKSQKAGGARFGCPSASIISGSWVVKFYL